MNRRALVAVAAAASIVLVGAWFLANFERVEIRVPVAPSAAARNNPYLAAMRFAERLGWRTRAEPLPARLQPASGHLTVLLPAGRTWLTPARVQDLLRWADNGAHLLVEAEPVRRRDRLLDALGIGRRSAHPGRASIEVAFPGAAAPLRLDAMGAQVLQLQDTGTEVLVADAQGVRLATMRRGAGRITVIAAMRRFDNRNIGRYDHAELLRQLLELAPGGQLLVVQAPATPGLWRWLAQHAAAALVAASVLLALALWRIVPRFGPVLPEPPPARRALLEHLRAAGRLRWSQGARSELLAGPRDQLERHIATAAPRLAHLPAPARSAALSSQFGADPVAVEHALQATARSAREIVQITATLASIHAGLRGARRRGAPKRNHP